LPPPSRAASRLPQWPSRLAVILSAIQVADAAGNLLIPQHSYTAHLDHLRVPRWLQPILPTLKVAASAGLMLGLRRPRVQALTSSALAGYYGGAIAFHLAAEDPAIIAVPPRP
jgi:DoxX-like family